MAKRDSMSLGAIFIRAKFGFGNQKGYAECTEMLRNHNINKLESIHKCN